MILNDKEYGQFDVSLGDDGTMDTVIVVEPLNDYAIDKAGTQEFRWTLEDEDGFYRDEDGYMTGEGFKDLAEQALEMYVETYLID